MEKDQEGPESNVHPLRAQTQTERERGGWRKAKKNESPPGETHEICW